MRTQLDNTRSLNDIGEAIHRQRMTIGIIIDAPHGAATGDEVAESIRKLETLQAQMADLYRERHEIRTTYNARPKENDNG